MNWNSEVLVFEERKNRITGVKPLGAKESSNNKKQTQPTYGVNSRSRTRATVMPLRVVMVSWLCIASAAVCDSTTLSPHAHLC